MRSQLDGEPRLEAAEDGKASHMNDPSNVPYQLRSMLVSDITSVVRVHLSSFKNFFLTFMGPRFLELLYHEILKDNGHVCFVAVSQEGEVVGFVVGVQDQLGLYERLARRRWFAFAFASSGVALRHPSVIPRLLRAFKYPTKANEASCPALLMSIAVSPTAKGRGVGQSLVARFLDAMADQGVDIVCLTTDRDHNEATNGFYRKLRFSKAREFVTPAGRWMNEYVIETQRRHR